MILQLGLRGWRTETLEVLSRFLHQMLCSLQSLRPWKKLKTIEKFGFVPISSSIRELISHPLDILATLQASRQKIQRSGSPWWDLQVASRGRLGESPGYAKTLVQNQLNHDNRDNIYSWIRADSFFTLTAINFGYAWHRYQYCQGGNATISTSRSCRNSLQPQGNPEPPALASVVLTDH